MSNLMDFLGQLEKLAYSMAVWIILIPKTIFKIIMDPTWVRGYVAKEFEESTKAEKEGKSGDKVRFDDYVSPVILLLLCSLVPYVGYQLLPPFGLSYIGGEQIGASAACVVAKPCTFNIEGNYFDSTYTVDWKFQDSPDASVDNKSETTAVDSSLNDDQLTYKITSQKDVTWTTPGTKEVSIELKDSTGTVIGSATRTVQVAEASANAQASDTTQASSSTAEQRAKKAFTSELQKNGLLGIFFLVPALTFALAARGLKGQQISAEALKEAFYAQCYYFTPISLFFYIVLYGTYFLTDDLLGSYFYFFLTLTGVTIWFVVAEIHAVAQERSFKSNWPAFWIVMGTSVFLLVVGTIVLILIFYPEGLRWLSYQLLNYGIIGFLIYSFLWRRIKPWWANRKKKEPVSVQPAQS